MRAFAELHELTALERDLEVLFVTIFSRERWTSDAPSDEADQRDERDDGPHLPRDVTLTRIFDDVRDREDIENGHDHDDDGNSGADG